jgi:hypothetical protein
MMMRGRSVFAHKSRLLAVMAALLLASLGAMAYASPAVRHQLALTFSKLPTRYTELYFSDSRNLPYRLSRSRPNAITFTIANHEGKTIVYSYLVTATNRLRAATVARQQVIIPSRGLANEKVTFSPRLRATYRIAIQLASPRPEMIALTATS